MGYTISPSSTPGVRGSESLRARSMVQWKKTDTQTVAPPGRKSCDGVLGGWGKPRRVLTQARESWGDTREVTS